MRAFRALLKANERKDKIEWTRKITNTLMPLYAIPSPQVKAFAKSISKGNALSFLQAEPYTSLEESFIAAYLIMRLPQEERKKYLDEYLRHVDCWATTDTLEFHISPPTRPLWWNYAQEYLRDPRPFVRRTGLRILFSYIECDEYLQGIYDVLDSLIDEREYYVNMCAAWLLCELVIKRREQTLSYLRHNKTNAFIVNKGVQKCRDSFRVSEEDKEYLLRFKR